MATYLATTAIGHFDIHAYRANGLTFWDAVDPQLFDADIPDPRTGSQYAWSRRSRGRPPSYKRLAHQIDSPGSLPTVVVLGRPRHRAELRLPVRRGAHRRPRQLDDAARRQRPHHRQHRRRVPVQPHLHPFLAHYMKDNGDGTCSPTGTTGTWRRPAGASDGYEPWTVDLSRFAGADDRGCRSATSATTAPRGSACSSMTWSGRPGKAPRRSRTTPTLSTVGRSPGPPPGEDPNPNDWTPTTS